MSQFMKTLIAGAVVASLTGCSSWFKKEEIEVVVVSPVEVQSLTYGVSHFEDRRDFVIYESGYEHVVLPTGRSVMYRKGWEEERLVDLAKALDAQRPEQSSSMAEGESQTAASSTATGKKSLPKSSDFTDPLERAWAKMCLNEITQITEGEWFLIFTTEMPDSLRSWCDERTARANIK